MDEINIISFFTKHITLNLINHIDPLNNLKYHVVTNKQQKKESKI